MMMMVVVGDDGADDNRDNRGDNGGDSDPGTGAKEEK